MSGHRALAEEWALDDDFGEVLTDEAAAELDWEHAMDPDAEDQEFDVEFWDPERIEELQGYEAEVALAAERGREPPRMAQTRLDGQGPPWFTDREPYLPLLHPDNPHGKPQLQAQCRFQIELADWPTELMATNPHDPWDASVYLLRQGEGTPLWSHWGDRSTRVRAPEGYEIVATAHRTHDEMGRLGGGYDEHFRRYGDVVYTPQTYTYVHPRCLLTTGELELIGLAFGEEVLERATDLIAHTELMRWEEEGAQGPEPCRCPAARMIAHNRFTGRVYLETLAPNRVWRFTADHGPGGYVRFFGPEDPDPEWARYPKINSQASVGRIRVFTGKDADKLLRRDPLLEDERRQQRADSQGQRLLF